MRPVYAAFDRFPSRKGAAIHIDRFARTLFDEFGGGALYVLGDEELPRYQKEALAVIPQRADAAESPDSVIPQRADAAESPDWGDPALKRGMTGTERGMTDIEIFRFAEAIPNFLDRALRFSAWLERHLHDVNLAHFRDPWSGAAIALRPHSYATVYEVNALPSIELPSLFPGLGPRTLSRIRALELDCCAAADLIITPSKTTAALLARLGVDASRIEVIPNGADLDTPKPRPDHAPEQYILYFGAAQSWQGIDTLLRAFARLADFPSLRLVLCASRETSSWRALARFAERLGIAERIVWKYALGEYELSRWRQHALVSVAPLTDCERNVVQGCAPLKILESMASGVAVVASDVPPVREIIRDRENGWLVHPERPAELARAIRILLDDRDRAHALGEAARRTIEQHFTWSRSTDALRRAYRKLMKGTAADERARGVPVAQ